MGAFSAELPKNYCVAYTDGTEVEHLLRLENMAKTADADDYTWVLLGRPSKGGRAKRKSSVAPEPAQAKKKARGSDGMTKEEVEAALGYASIEELEAALAEARGDA